MTRPRRIATICHRYAGLVLAGFLTIVGLTGATIAWNDELERIFAPAMFVLPAATSAQPALDPFDLREAAERAVPGYAVNGIDFTREPDQPALFYVEARPGGVEPDDDQIALDPASGRLLAGRRHGDLRQGAINLMPFIYDLHDSLVLGDTGVLILGVVALLWTIDCFIGGWLTFPVSPSPRSVSEARPAASWLRRWRKSWFIRKPTAPFKLTFDLHRTGGLWLWVMLFGLAWSSVGFNLPAVYNPVMAAIFGDTTSEFTPKPLPPAQPPRLDWREAHAAARFEMRAAAAREGFTVKSERLMFYDPSTHVYAYRVKSDRDPGRLGNTQVRIDGDTGRLLQLDVPTGGNTGTTISTWLGELHTAGVFGTGWKILLSIVGIGIAMLSVTGVMIWLRKHGAREAHRARALRPTADSSKRA